MITEFFDTDGVSAHDRFQAWRTKHQKGVFLTLPTRARASLHGARCQHLGSGPPYFSSGDGLGSLTSERKVCGSQLELLTWAAKNGVAVKRCLHCMRDGLIQADTSQVSLPQNGSGLPDIEVAPARTNAEDRRGKDLAKSWGLNVRQALYRKTGDWFHQLTKFPAALLDENGYLTFADEQAFHACSHLRVGKDPHRHGGWISAPNGIKTIPGYVHATDRSLVETALRPRVPSGQRWGGTPEDRRAIETYAMDLAIRHYATIWPDVKDVSATEPYDLLCRERDRELRVEVKGTTSLGLSVFLTRNEVRHAQENNGRVALFIVCNIVAGASGCVGGDIDIVEPWDIRQDELEPIAFECRLRARHDR